MVMTSVGQINNESAKMIYKMAGRTADSLLKAGKIAASDRNVTWARMVAERMTRMNLEVPKAIAAQVGIRTAGKGTVSVARGTVAQAAGASAGASIANATVSQAAKGVIRGAVPITIAFFAAETAHTAYKYATGDIDMAEAKRRTAESAATNTGGLGGAVAGAAIGTAIFPGAGTIIGGAVGGIGGAIASSKLVQRFTR
ncbi:MAG: hypothetical protein OEL20_05635 [Sulfuritalea sp.]|nr:hypothetical protein [Sulfuritalea sp.]